MNTILHKARYYLTKGSYSRAYKLLVPHAPKFKNHYEYLYLSGIAAFGTGNIDSAYEYFTTAVSLASSAQSHDAKLYLAVIALASRNMRKAAEYWLSITDEQSNNQYALRGLKHLQQLEDNNYQRIADIARNPYKYKIVPQLTYPFQKLYKIGKLTLLLVSSVFFSYGVYFTAKKSIDFYKKRNAMNKREALISHVASDRKTQTKALIRGDSYPRYVILSPNAIRSTLKNMEKHFILYKDNLTQIDINTILYSNALANDKRKAILLEGYLKKRDFSSNVTWFPYTQVQSAPWQYDKTSVRWRGTITQITENKRTRKGNFLVGFYGNNKNLEGIVPVRIPAFIDVNTGDEIEILGIIMIDVKKTESKNINTTNNEISLPQNFSVEINAIQYLIK